MSDSKIVIPIPDSVMMRPKGYWDRKVALDADEVLLKYLAALEEHIRSNWKRNNIDRVVDLKGSDHYYLHANPARTGLTREEAGFFMREFAQKTRGGFGDLEFYPGAIQAVMQLWQHRIHPLVITDVPDGLQTSADNHQPHGWSTGRAAREAQLLSVGIIRTKDDIIFCEAHRKPSEMVDGLHRIPILVDDRKSTLMLAQERGLIAIGIRRPELRYNHGDCEGIIWFESLEEAIEPILDVFRRLGDRVKNPAQP
jgi:hypothetical protein